MLTTVHGAIGVIIGQNVSNPILSFILGFIFHFIIDMIPHGDRHCVDEYLNKKTLKKITKVIIIDSIIGAIFLILYFNGIVNTDINFKPIAAGIIGSILPDLLVAFYSLNRRYFFRLNYIHHRLHQLIKKDIPLGLSLFLQVLLITVLWQFYNF